MTPSVDCILVDLGAGRVCPVVLGTGQGAALTRSRWQAGWRDAVIVGDQTVLALHGAPLAEALAGVAARVHLLPFPPGEHHKTRATKEHVEDQMLAAGVGRATCVVGLGGGISLDVAGFVAATYMRGVPWVAVPTSLLGQVDASVGGKTGVNTDHGKNLVGAFHQPAAVVVDRAYLATLPAEEWLNGWGEVVKHAVVGDREMFQALERGASRLAVPGEMDDEILRRAVATKVAVVQEDERECGLREVLNFGHTVGHALEAATGYRVSHGRAVGVGMVVESLAATSLCGFPREEWLRLRALLATLGVTSPDLFRTPFDRLVEPMLRDKKRRGDAVRVAIPRALGHMARQGDSHSHAVGLDVLRACWEEAACSA
jgi:3-dehydroquinate synthase